MTTIEEMKNTLSELKKARLTYGKLYKEFLEAKIKYRDVSAKIFLDARNIEGLKTVAEKEAWVHEQILNEYKDFKMSEGKLDAQKEGIKILLAILSGLQSINSNSRSI
jgi:hypothetical protein